MYCAVGSTAPSATFVAVSRAALVVAPALLGTSVSAADPRFAGRARHSYNDTMQ
jgi:hypothetical protein